MNKDIRRAILMGAGIMLLQIAVLGNVSVWGYITPYVYVLLLFLLPYGMGKGWLMLWGFLIGLTVDVFSSTGGLHAMACTLIISIRDKGVTNFLGVPEKELDSFSLLNSADVKPVAMVVLFFGMVVIHHVVLYVLEAMSLSLLWSALWHALLNAVVTMVTGVVMVVLLAPAKRRRL